MPTVIKLIRLADGEPPTSLDDTYVVEYDPSRPGVTPTGDEIICHLVTTPNIAEAKLFNEVQQAFEYWRASYGLRDDGRPNRPLTAYTCAFLEFIPARAAI